MAPSKRNVSPLIYDDI